MSIATSNKSYMASLLPPHTYTSHPLYRYTIHPTSNKKEVPNRRCRMPKVPPYRVTGEDWDVIDSMLRLARVPVLRSQKPPANARQIQAEIPQLPAAIGLAQNGGKGDRSRSLQSPGPSEMPPQITRLCDSAHMTAITPTTPTTLVQETTLLQKKQHQLKQYAAPFLIQDHHHHGHRNRAQPVSPPTNRSLGLDAALGPRSRAAIDKCRRRYVKKWLAGTSKRETCTLQPSRKNVKVEDQLQSVEGRGSDSIADAPRKPHTAWPVTPEAPPTTVGLCATSRNEENAMHLKHSPRMLMTSSVIPQTRAVVVDDDDDDASSYRDNDFWIKQQRAQFVMSVMSNSTCNRRGFVHCMLCQDECWAPNGKGNISSRGGGGITFLPCRR
jgi:hypothetical protein